MSNLNLIIDTYSLRKWPGRIADLYRAYRKKKKINNLFVFTQIEISKKKNVISAVSSRTRR